MDNKEKQIIELKLKIKKLESERLYHGVYFSISAARELLKEPLHKWSHSRELKFAPVEISDVILLEYRKTDEYKAMMN